MSGPNWPVAGDRFLEKAEFETEGILEEERSGSPNNRLRLIVVLLVVGLALGYMVYAAFPGNALFSLTVSEFFDKAEAQDGRIVRVSGKLVEDSFAREDNSTLAAFQLIDKEETGSAAQLAATYDGVLPDLFFNPHSEIILQGSYGQGEVFHADTILVKCPSKYQALEEEQQASS